MGSRESPPPPPPPLKRPRLEAQLLSKVMHMPLDDFIFELAKQYLYDILEYYQKYNTCSICHELIPGIPVTFWTCDSCFLCEECACKTHDTHGYSWSEYHRTAKYHSIMRLDDGFIPIMRDTHDVLKDLKCFICRDDDNCNNTPPHTCNIKMFTIGKQMVEALRPRQIQSVEQITRADIERFQTIHNTYENKVSYKCPYCIVIFPSNHLSKYINHQFLCSFRPNACPFPDCDITFRQSNLLAHCINRTSMAKDIYEVTVPDTGVEFIQQHCVTECQHKIVCNLVDCKQHLNNDRVVFLCHASTHLETYFQNLPPLLSTEFNNKIITTWTEEEMVRRFPDSMKRCHNHRYQDESASVALAERLENENDDDEDDVRVQQPSIILHLNGRQPRVHRQN